MTMLPIDVKPPEYLGVIHEESVKGRRIGRLRYAAIKEEWRPYLDDWFTDNFETRHLNSVPDYCFLTMPAGRDGEPHVDILKADHGDGRGRAVHVRQCALNYPLSDSGHLDYVSESGEVLDSYSHGGFALYKTDVLHRSVNEYGEVPRIVFSVGFFKDSFEKVAMLQQTGRFAK